MKRLLIALIAVTVLSGPVAAYAQETAPVAGQGLQQRRAEKRAQLQAMSPEERQAHIADRKAQAKAKWDSLTPEQQARLKAAAEQRRANRGAAGGFGGRSFNR
jgi:Ni/Co efflux regulator RcnB